MRRSILNELRISEKVLNETIHNTPKIQGVYAADQGLPNFKFSNAEGIQYYNIAFPSDILRMWLNEKYIKASPRAL